jgi:GTP1/Obg family GTP-binding protein
MERLTIASVEHLPTCVVFVMDLTGLCGTTVANQVTFICSALQTPARLCCWSCLPRRP